MYAEHSTNPSIHKCSLMNFGITCDISIVYIVTHSVMSKSKCLQFLFVLYYTALQLIINYELFTLVDINSQYVTDCEGD